MNPAARKELVAEMHRFIDKDLYAPITSLGHDPDTLRMVAKDAINKLVLGNITGAFTGLMKLDGRGRSAILRRLEALSVLPQEWQGGDLILH